MHSLPRGPLFASCLVLSLAAGCGGSDAECVIDSDCDLFFRCMAEQCVPVGGGTDGGDDGGTETDGGGGFDGGDETDGGATDLGVGTVSIGQTPFEILMMDMSSYSMSAAFTASGAGASGCTTSTEGACEIAECTTPPPPADGGVATDGGLLVFANAGGISLSGGLVDLMINPAPTGLYTPANGMGRIWDAGTELTVTAAGDEVPAFTANVTGPAQVTVTAPAFAGGMVSISRSADFAVSWMGDETADTVAINISGSETLMDGSARTIQLACLFPATDGTGAIPAEARALLPSGGTGSISIGSRSSTTIDASGWDVTINAASAALAMDTSAPAAATATFVD